MKRSHDDRVDHSAIAVLIVLQTLMLGALYTGSEPHPPLAIPPFALAPFLSASIALAVAAPILGVATRLGRAAVVFAALTALVPFGPHKWVDDSITQIWPAIALAEVACGVLLARPLWRDAPTGGHRQSGGTEGA